MCMSHYSDTGHRTKQPQNSEEGIYFNSDSVGSVHGQVGSVGSVHCQADLVDSVHGQAGSVGSIHSRVVKSSMLKQKQCDQWM